MGRGPSPGRGRASGSDEGGLAGGTPAPGPLAPGGPAPGAPGPAEASGRPGASLARALSLARRAFAARERFDRGVGGAAALEEAIADVREALALPLAEPGLRAALEGRLSSHLYHRWRLSGRTEALQEAVALGRDALLDGRHPDPVEVHRNQCGALVALFETTTDLALLSEAEEHGRRAVRLTPPGHPARAGCLSNLALVLHRVHQFRRDPAALDAAVAAEREALACLAPDDPLRPRHQHNLAGHLRARYEATRDLDALEEACALGRAAAGALGDPLHQVSAAGALLTRYLARGDLADAHEALALEERALERVAPDDPRRPAYLNITSATLGHLAARTGDAAWARRAVAVSAEAVAATAPGHLDRPGHLRTLSSHRLALFRLTGDTETLRAAVRDVEEALDALPSARPERGACRSVLVEALVTLYDHTQEPGLLDDAVRAARAALKEGPESGAQRVPWLNNLSGTLRARHWLDHDRAYLDEAVATAREAVRLAGDDPRLPLYLGTLCSALRDLDGVTGGDLGLRTELVAAARRALAGTPEDSPDRGRRTGELAWTLVLLAGAPGVSGAAAREAAAEAVSLARRALRAVPRERAEHAGVALTLGTALALADGPALDGRPVGAESPSPRAESPSPRAESPSPRAEAPTPWAEAAEVLAAGAAATASLPQDRLECARALCALWLAAGRPAEALDAVEQAVGLLPYVAPRHLARSGRERGLERHAGLPQQAVAAALAAGRPGRAVELLERTRGVLLGEAIEARDGPAALPAPLAAEFARLRELLAVPPRWAHGPPDDRLSVLAEGEQRRVLAARWEDLLERIRHVPGLADFLRPPALPELVASAAGGPVVMVVEGPAGGHALVVGAAPAGRGTDADADADGVTVVPLPALTPGAAQRWAARLREPLGRGEPLDRRDLLALLAWLWEAVAEPVLTALAPAPGSRLWWCPTGALALLPLHAAGRYGTERAVGVLDRVVSSYTPTLRALAYARSRVSAADGGALVVAVPEPRSAYVGPLPGAVREAEGVARRLRGARLLCAAEAERASVLAALPRHTVAHFACHGAGDTVSPAGNGVLLADADGVPLTVAAVAGLDLRGAALAYLSACGTSETRISLADESVHLASGFQVAGYPQVVGSLWSVPDLASARVADAFYAHAAEDGRLVPARVPHALHHAVLALRHRYPGSPELWAPFVHHGA
ncbi:CHAT domain-containing protein [Streptomyces sp. NPDC059894]|uniref:CHAT domain-containing protein n=1 Tax=unclassified Streptomyces TaxID=2593676 RepID=UPI0036665D40